MSNVLVCRGEYNVALTGAAFVDADVLFPAYWSPAVAAARSLVDEQTNCEDILMNYVAGNATLQVSAAAVLLYLPHDIATNVFHKSGRRLVDAHRHPQSASFKRELA